MKTVASEDAALQFVAGMASFLNDEMRITSPLVRRQSNRYHHQFKRREQYYWLVRTAINYMLDIGHGCEMVIGIAVVFKTGIELHVFTHNYKQADQISLTGAIAAYKLFACNDNERDWVLKVVQENLDERQ